jgi:Fe-Mn family superoxide dismutase
MNDKVYFSPQADFYPGFLSKEQIKIHFEGHHLGYLKAAERTLGPLNSESFARHLKQNKNNNSPLANNLRQIFLHNKFWENLLQNPSKLLESQEFFEKVNRRTSLWQKIQNLYIFGSGWVIAYVSRGELKVDFYQNAEIPDGEIVFVLDLWEHSFYLDHQNRRNDYLEGCKKYLDWKLVYNRLKTMQILT